MEKIRTHKDLKVYQLAFNVALKIHELTQSFPTEEKYSLTDQIRRSSRSVCANLAEAFRKRRYPKHFVLKISDCEGEASETEFWLELSYSLKYIKEDIYNQLYEKYEHILAMLITMSNNPHKWTI